MLIRRGLIIVGSIVTLLIILGIGLLINHEIDFFNAEPFKQECILLCHDYSPSTKKTRLQPVIGLKGKVSFVAHTTGHPEIYTTVWDCGEYGRLISKDRYIFQYAQEKSVLLLKKVDKEVRIYDIER